MNSNNSKKQSARIIISETLMFLAVVITVILLALLVSGYWLNSNFQVQRNGMLQISSYPTGATVEVDGEVSSWLERTNSSKILSSGEHTITLTKDGYDSWTKVVNISEGLLYRLHYPRLFLKERSPVAILDMTKYASATISSNHNSALLLNDTTKWGFLNLDADEPKLRSLDISKLFSSITPSTESEPSHFTGKILQADWDFDSSHVLFKVAKDDNIEWVLLDVNDIEKSINLTKEFGTNFSRIEILDNNSNTLLAVQNRNLHKIDIPGRLISAILVANIDDFDHYNNEIVFSAAKDSSEGEVLQNQTSSTDSSTDISTNVAKQPYYVGYFRLGDTNLTELTSTATPVKVTISRFYDSKYVTIINEQNVSIHQKDNFDEGVMEYVLSFVPEKIKVGHDGEFLFFEKSHQLATLDMEAKAVREWSIEGVFDWVDNNMLYSINNGELTVYDFDGLNRRTIAQNVSSHFPVSITNDKWLYYFSDGTLEREQLAN